MKWNRTTAIFATIGAAATGYLAVMAYRHFAASQDKDGSALSEGDRYVAGDIASTRAAGPDAMRDPPSKWDAVDQAVDESFPASDPAPVGSRVD